MGRRTTAGAQTGGAKLNEWKAGGCVQIVELKIKKLENKIKNFKIKSK